jgi:hypothetical protein
MSDQKFDATRVRVFAHNDGNYVLITISNGNEETQLEITPQLKVSGYTSTVSLEMRNVTEKRDDIPI